MKRAVFAGNPTKAFGKALLEQLNHQLTQTSPCSVSEIECLSEADLANVPLGEIRLIAWATLETAVPDLRTDGFAGTLCLPIDGCTREAAAAQLRRTRELRADAVFSAWFPEELEDIASPQETEFLRARFRYVASTDKPAAVLAEERSILLVGPDHKNSFHSGALLELVDRVAEGRWETVSIDNQTSADALLDSLAHQPPKRLASLSSWPWLNAEVARRCQLAGTQVLLDFADLGSPLHYVAHGLRPPHSLEAGAPRLSLRAFFLSLFKPGNASGESRSSDEACSAKRPSSDTVDRWISPSPVPRVPQGDFKSQKSIRSYSQWLQRADALELLCRMFKEDDDGLSALVRAEDRSRLALLAARQLMAKPGTPRGTRLLSDILISGQLDISTLREDRYTLRLADAALFAATDFDDSPAKRSRAQELLERLMIGNPRAAPSELVRDWNRMLRLPGSDSSAIAAPTASLAAIDRFCSVANPSALAQSEEGYRLLKAITGEICRHTAQTDDIRQTARLAVLSSLQGDWESAAAAERKARSLDSNGRIALCAFNLWLSPSPQSAIPALEALTPEELQRLNAIETYRLLGVAMDLGREEMAQQLAARLEPISAQLRTQFRTHPLFWILHSLLLEAFGKSMLAREAATLAEAIDPRFALIGRGRSIAPGGLPAESVDYLLAIEP